MATMTNDEIRRAKLAELISDAGSVAAVARALGVSSSQISQWKNASPDSKTGKPRVMQDSSARRMEDVFSKPRGWMDSATAVVVEQHTPTIINDKPTADKYQEHVINAHAKTIAQQASEVAHLWMDLPAHRKNEVLQQLREEVGSASSNDVTMLSKRPRARIKGIAGKS
jgi:transposase-like protein